MTDTGKITISKEQYVQLLCAESQLSLLRTWMEKFHPKELECLNSLVSSIKDDIKAGRIKL